jgi:octanoyl-[GcvH]:protein N-octanoyltransferase
VALAASAIQLVSDSFPDRPAFDTAVSRALLERVASGALPDTMRLARPGAMVAFGKQDTNAAGYDDAVRAARAAGFEAVQRLAGGRAAVFHEQTVALAWSVADRDALSGTHARFREAAAIVVAALQSLAVDARVGEVPGEYCPGEYSVNARGARKVAGIGQRVIKGGAHIGGVIVVAGGERIRDVLVPVYAALGLEWDPETTGSVQDEVEDASFSDVLETVRTELAARYELRETKLDADTLALAERLEPAHRSP